LSEKPEIVALSKCDAVDAETLAERAEALRKVARKKPLLVSAVAHTGVKEALFALTREITRQDGDQDGEDDKAWSP
jgi:GTP-binding protein